MTLGQDKKKVKLPDNKSTQVICLIQDFEMIVAGLKQTYPSLDIFNTRARDILNIYIPNMNKETTFMELVRIRSTPVNKLTKEERQYRNAHRIKNIVSTLTASDFIKALKGGK